MILPFVDGFVKTPVGSVAQVATTLTCKDHLGSLGARTGFQRNNYLIVPGLYCTGTPTENSPVLVTANYKLSFDSLRKELGNTDTWILVIDSRGINVWCAAGKRTFCAEEISYQVQRAKLDQIVNHRKLILPQLSANGVAKHTLKKQCGFTAEFGPVLAADLNQYLTTGSADEKMRSITFTLKERAVLIPVEICILWKQLLFICLLLFILSGISPEIFSPGSALSRGTVALTATLTAIIAGALATPLLLPWLLFRQFWLKGALLGSIMGCIFLLLIPQTINDVEKLSLFLWITGAASFLAMNFTGATPFTSISGVAKEMRRGLPFQLIAAATALVLWLTAPFI